MSERSDEDLVARVVAVRDAAAFETLVRRYHAKVRNWLRQLTRDGARADDLAQETFLRAWQRAHTFSASGSFASWLMKIAYNEHLQALRKQAQRGRLETALAAEQGTDASATHSDETPDAARMLEVLTDDERSAMILCYGHGMSHAEAAEILGMPVGTLKSHLYRAKAKIRDRFALAAAAAAGA